MRRFGWLLVGSMFIVACEKTPVVEPTTVAPEVVPTTAAAPVGWTEVADEELTESQKTQVAKAAAAQAELGPMLVKALTTSVAEKGFGESVEFCRGEAPGLTETVGKTHGVKIGRTSSKLRNANNVAPQWADLAVKDAKASPRNFAGPAGELGTLRPIILGELCTNCHGNPDQLADGVSDALTEKYPEDEAIGYSPGDLRGWFWVEVPAS